MSPSEFADILRPIIMRYNGSVTSGLRSVKRNDSIGGKLNSRHLLDLAKDVKLDNPEDNEAFMQECRRQGMIAVPSNNGAVHVQTR